MKFASRIFFALTVLQLCILLAGCSSAWTSEAGNIIVLLGPAITSLLGIITAFGVGISPTALVAIQKWSAEAQTDLVEVKSLIDQYTAASATAQPGILNEIDTLVGTITSNLQTILPDLHITDPATQAKIQAVITLVSSELEALLQLIPVIQGTVTNHAEAKARFLKLKSADEFKKSFNSAAQSFGKQYTI